MNKKQLKWQNPLELSEIISQNYKDNWIFLYSGLSQEIENSKSIIALEQISEFTDFNLDNLEKKLDSACKNYDNSFFGYISYEYKDQLEIFKKEPETIIRNKLIHLINFSIILEFDHSKQVLIAYYKNREKLENILKYKTINNTDFKVKINNLSSNYSKNHYLNSINFIKEKIKSGDIYQTNLTRKFYGDINAENCEDYFNIFLKLNKESPANFSAFLKINEKYIISSSPELFLDVSDQRVISRPIKGTSPRDKNEIQDLKNKEYLLNSIKEKAENLMIVDLVRNDISKSCKASSVKTENLFKVNSYSTLHHLSSEIFGILEEEKTTIDAFKNCFPAGSMTGAPKIKAIEIAQELEKINRGIYSGAIGYFKDQKNANFSVVIRTIICQNNKFEFQVGGAITYDSLPENEFEETLTKAKGICKALNLSIEELRNL